MDTTGAWTSLEAVKLAVSAMIPLSVAFIGFVFTRATKRIDADQWLNQKLIGKRIELVESALPGLNDLYCYFSWVGKWKELSPEDVIKRKRSLDSLFYTNRAFFTPQVLVDYESLLKLLFKTFADPGVDAKLRTEMTSHDGTRAESYTGTWDAKWDKRFTEPGDCSSRGEIKRQYEALINRLADEVR